MTAATDTIQCPACGNEQSDDQEQRVVDDEPQDARERKAAPQSESSWQTEDGPSERQACEYGQSQRGNDAEVLPEKELETRDGLWENDVERLPLDLFVEQRRAQEDGDLDYQSPLGRGFTFQEEREETSTASSANFNRNPYLPCTITNHTRAPQFATSSECLGSGINASILWTVGLLDTISGDYPRGSVLYNTVPLYLQTSAQAIFTGNEKSQRIYDCTDDFPIHRLSQHNY